MIARSICLAALFICCTSRFYSSPAQERFPPRAAQRSPIYGNNVVGREPLGDLASSDFFSRLVDGSQADKLEPRSLRIASYNGLSPPALLTRGKGSELATTANVSQASDWWVTAAGNGLVRVQTYDHNRVYAIGAQSSEHVSLLPLAQDPRQLWRVTGAGRVADRYLLENAQFPGLCLTNMAGGGLTMQPINFAPAQLWLPLTPPLLPSFQPFYRSIHREVHVNPQLPAAQVELINSHRSALLVLLGDKRTGNQVQSIRIPANGAQHVPLDRDAGSTLIETVETRNALGGWERQQLVTAIPPTAFYDLSVYEEHLQSIAIDRTGKSPNVIEDVNYVPKSVGWIPVPAGAALPSSVRLDVYAKAAASNNAGAVRKFDPRQFDEPAATNPLQELLQELTPATVEPAAAPSAAVRRQF